MSFTLIHKSTKKSATPLFRQIIDLLPKHILYDAIRSYQSDIPHYS
jgi:hypothetical protein